MKADTIDVLQCTEIISNADANLLHNEKSTQLIVGLVWIHITHSKHYFYQEKARFFTLFLFYVTSGYIVVD